MDYTGMKTYLKKNIMMMFVLGAALLFTLQVGAQTNGKTGKGLYELFSTRVPDGAQWTKSDHRYVRHGGYSKKSENYIYVEASKSPAELTGLSIPIRENPGPGEYRYITFAWIKWGGEQIGMQFNVSEESAGQKGKKYDFSYIAGKPKDLINQLKGLNLGDMPVHWVVRLR